MSILDKLFGNTSEKEVKRIQPTVNKILALEGDMQALSDEELQAKTPEFKERLSAGETLDDLLPEAYAAVREAAWRTLHMKHFPVQLTGGVVLHQGRIAEMYTGEGKTLVATLPAYLNALEGKGVHVVTVNDYLAKRDAEWMGAVYHFMGLSVGCILNQMDKPERQAAYNCDITYGTNNEFGFDYLRDNMVVYKKNMVQRELNYAIIDEVDSILIDEARTPLIISGRGSKSTSLYKQADTIASRLKKGRIIGDTSKMAQLMQEEVQEEGDFIIDEKENSCTLTAQGVEKVEKYFGLENYADPENAEIAHYMKNALRARYMMNRDQDYVVSDGKIVIVDEFTGRLMPGRRYNDGLHQAIEAKEDVEVKRESKTLATITFQNYFNKYAKKAGMTGTAKTEETEFQTIYGMDVVEIPTNMPIKRVDHPDSLYKTKKEKYEAAIADIVACHEKGQPVLVGTITIEDSELLSRMLKSHGIPHTVLNAKFHEKEAEIIAQAGQPGSVTIATNMAGRGTDIKLGEGVAEMGGLKIIGTERHESRRIDNQLRGRSGRQGDPGESRFYISTEDDLVRIFGGDRMTKVMSSLKIPEGVPIEDKSLTKVVAQAQRRVEENNFGIRKRLLEYDQVMNQQREVIYSERRKVLEGENVHDEIMNMMHTIIESGVSDAVGDAKFPEDWNLAQMNERIRSVVPVGEIKIGKDELDSITSEQLSERLKAEADELYAAKELEINEEAPDRMREVERVVLLKVIDTYWMDHIDLMDQMRQSIGLQSYAQKNPLDEYRITGLEMFEELTATIQENTVRNMFRIKIKPKEEVKRQEVAKGVSTNRGQEGVKTKKTVKRTEKKVGRNDPCPCGSGKKYKNCCGRNAS